MTSTPQRRTQDPTHPAAHPADASPAPGAHVPGVPPRTVKVAPPPALHAQPSPGTGVPTVPGGPLADVVRNNDHVLQEVRPLPLPSDDEVNKDDSASNIVRQHWALFLRNGREQRKYLRDILRDEGFARSFLTVLFHVPVSSSAFALYILLASHLGSVHDAGYAVAAFAGAYAVQVMMGPMLVRALGLRALLGVTSLLNIAATANMLVIGWRLTVDPNNVSTLYHALSCVAMGFTTPPWTPFALESLYRRNYPHCDGRLATAVSWGTTANLLMHPLAALMIWAGDAYIAPNHEYSGFWITIGLDALLFLVVLVAPKLLPDVSRLKTATKKARMVRPSLQTAVLVIGLVLLGGCVGSVGSGLLGFALMQGSMNMFMAMVAVGTGSMVLVAFPVILGGQSINPWHGWLLSGILLVLGALYLPTSVDTSTIFYALVLCGATLGVAFAGHELSLSRSLKYVPDAQASFFTRALLGIGMAMGCMWGGYMGDAPYYRNAFMVPVIVATMYFALGHLYGYLWREEHEEKLAPLEA
ncbi:MFS transporter [Rothia mucilaginosa]|uniref:MFS transporter n=1 Tax=Rothia mucilaginosa TaxID=43675 RepID=UPI0026EDA17D|nr:MFS transporter [Rothia mucilaginosa]